MTTLTFDDYQRRSATTAIYPDRGTSSPMALAYVCLGLGEVGEVQEKVATLPAHPTADQRREVGAELGDVLWYISQLATELDTPLSTLTGGLTIAEYQQQTAVRGPQPLTGAALSLGVAGDVQGLIKKILRGDPATTDPCYPHRVTARLGHLLTAVAVTATAAGMNLETLAQANLDKLADRARRGVLRGAGDHR